jgi:hypothetical protein
MAETNQPRRIISRKRALACLAMNALALPGLGTVMAGRAIGYVQATLMLVGFCMFMGYMLWYFLAFSRFVFSHTSEEFGAHYRPWLWVLWLGLGLCIVAWVWSLVSSFLVLRQSTADAPPRIQ